MVIPENGMNNPDCAVLIWEFDVSIFQSWMLVLMHDEVLMHEFVYQDAINELINNVKSAIFV
jgi:hypothetical protein